MLGRQDRAVLCSLHFHGGIGCRREKLGADFARHEQRSSCRTKDEKDPDRRPSEGVLEWSNR